MLSYHKLYKIYDIIYMNISDTIAYPISLLHSRIGETNDYITWLLWQWRIDKVELYTVCSQ